jgi:hypothetical protein
MRREMEGIDPKSAANIRQHVAAIAERDYPRVWVGEEGMTAEELFRLQLSNDESPEWLRIEPGDRVEIDESGAGVRMPSPSVDWIEGDKALALIPDHFVEGELGNLQDEVSVIRAARLGVVMVRTAFTVAYAVGEELETLSEDDRLSLTTAWFEHGGELAAMFYTGSTYRMTPLDELTAADVDDDLLEALEFYASGETWEPYVVDETLRARALVARCLQG